MLTVNNRAWHYLIYEHWRQHIARKPPRQIDLCHYMRAIMLFTPGYYIGLVLLYLCIVLFYALVAAFCVVTVPLWGPVWLVTHNRDWHKRGARRAAAALAWPFEKAGSWLIDHGDRVALAALGIFVISMFTLLSLDRWWLGLAVAGGVFGALVAVTLLLLGIYEFAKWYGPRHALKRAEKRDKQMRELMNRPRRPVKPPKGPSWLSLMWQFVKAKKKRICPLIQVDERRTA